LNTLNFERKKYCSGGRLKIQDRKWRTKLDQRRTSITGKYTTKNLTRKMRDRKMRDQIDSYLHGTVVKRCGCKSSCKSGLLSAKNYFSQQRTCSNTIYTLYAMLCYEYVPPTERTPFVSFAQPSQWSTYTYTCTCTCRRRA